VTPPATSHLARGGPHGWPSARSRSISSRRTRSRGRPACRTLSLLLLLLLLLLLRPGTKVTLLPPSQVLPRFLLLLLPLSQAFPCPLS
jgi:hypothetical protein